MTEQGNSGFPGTSRGGNGGAVDLLSKKKLKRGKNFVHPEGTFGETSSKKLCLDKKQQGDDGTAVRKLSFTELGTPKMPERSKDSVVPKTPVTWTQVPEGNNKLPSTWFFRTLRDRKYFRCPNGNEYTSLKAAMEALINSSSSLAQSTQANNLPPEEIGKSTPLSKNAVDNQPIKTSLTEVEMYFVCQRLIPSLQNG